MRAHAALESAERVWTSAKVKFVVPAEAIKRAGHLVDLCAMRMAMVNERLPVRLDCKVKTVNGPRFPDPTMCVLHYR